MATRHSDSISKVYIETVTKIMEAKIESAVAKIPELRWYRSSRKGEILIQMDIPNTLKDVIRTKVTAQLKDTPGVKRVIDSIDSLISCRDNVLGSLHIGSDFEEDNPENGIGDINSREWLAALTAFLTDKRTEEYTANAFARTTTMVKELINTVRNDIREGYLLNSKQEIDKIRKRLNTKIDVTMIRVMAEIIIIQNDSKLKKVRVKKIKNKRELNILEPE